MVNGGFGPPPVEGDHDLFLSSYTTLDLQTVSEFLTNWLPFLSKDVCRHCFDSLIHHVKSLNQREYATKQPYQHAELYSSTPNHTDLSCKNGAYGVSGYIGETSGSERRLQSPEYFKTPMPPSSLADIDMEHEELEADQEEEVSEPFDNCEVELPSADICSANVTRRDNFICFQRVDGYIVNILQGLELHCGVFSSAEQKKIVDHVYELQVKGQNGELKEHTFTSPPKWLRGKGRVTIEFGRCYNYATDRNGNSPGIPYNKHVDPIPNLFKLMIKKLVKWHVLPLTCEPDSCIVNILHEGDNIPPHIDNHDFLRPVCTVSFLSECNILFGLNLNRKGPGKLSDPYKIPLPVGSVLVFNGNGADVAEHCVPAAPTKRISITFRKMDESKWPAGFPPKPDLQGLEPLVYEDTPKRFKHL